MQALARYDDAAKQLITIGGLLQGGLIAVYSILDKQGHILQTGWQIAILVLFELFLITFISLAAWACTLQPEMQATRISDLLTKALKICVSETDLIDEVTSWCIDIESKIKKKQCLMLVAKISYILCLIMPALLVFLLMR